MFKNWTNSSKRYMLVTVLGVVENDLNKTSGVVTNHLHFHVSSDSINDLRKLWNHNFIQQRFETPNQHFIADMREKKIVEFLSVCM